MLGDSIDICRWKVMEDRVEGGVGDTCLETVQKGWVYGTFVKSVWKAGYLYSR